MSGQWWSLIGIIVSCLGGYFTARLSVKADSKKRKAEELALGIETQNKIMKSWEVELARRDIKITRQDNLILDLEQRLEAIEADLHAAHEKSELASQQLGEERKRVRLLTQSLETAQARLRAALAELKALKERLRHKDPPPDLEED